MNLTIRNIPDEIIEKIRTLSKIGKRSMNNEILIILEQGVQEQIAQTVNREEHITKETQIKIWEKLANEWEDHRSTQEIIEDIYNNRTIGRDILL